MTDISKREKLYNNLIGTGRVSEQQIGTKDQFLQSIDSRENAAQLHKNLSSVFSPDEIGDELAFGAALEPDFAPKPNLVNDIYSRQDGSVQGIMAKNIQDSLNRPAPGMLTLPAGQGLPAQPGLTPQQSYSSPKPETPTLEGVDSQLKNIQDIEGGFLDKFQQIERQISPKQYGSIRESSAMGLGNMFSAAKVSKEDRAFYEASKTKAEEVRSSINTLNIQKDLLRLSQNQEKYNPDDPAVKQFWNGLVNTGLTKDFATLGITEIDRNFDIINIFNRVSNDPLSVTPEEKDLIKVYSNLQTLQSQKKDWKYQGGQQFQMMVPFVAQMIATGGIGAGLREGIGTVLKVGVKKGLAKFGARLAEGLIFNVPRSAVTTTFGTTFAQNRLQGYDTDKSGNVDKRDDALSLLKDLGNSYIQNYLEYATEEFGDLVPSGMATKLLANKKVAKLFGGTLGQINKVTENKSFQAVKKITDLAQIQGVPSEIMEEVIGAVASTGLTGSNDIQQLSDPSFYKTIGLNTLLMGGSFMGAQYSIGGVSSAIEKNRVSKQADQSILGLDEIIPTLSPELQVSVNNLSEQIRTSQFTGKSGRADDSGVIKALDETYDLIEQGEQSEQTDNVRSLISRAITTNATKVGMYTGIEAMAEQELGAFTHKKDPKSVVIAIDEDDNQYFVIDQLDQEEGNSLMVVRPIAGGETKTINSYDLKDSQVVDKRDFINNWLQAKDIIAPAVAQEEEIQQQTQQPAEAQEIPADPTTIQTGNTYLLGGEQVKVIDATEDGIWVQDREGGEHNVQAEELSNIPVQQPVEQPVSQETAPIEQPVEAPAEIVPGLEGQAINAPVAEVPVEKPVPLTKDGSPDYDKMEPEMLVSQLSKEFKPERVSGMLLGVIGNLQKTRESLNKKLPKGINEEVAKIKKVSELDNRIMGLRSSIEKLAPKQVEQAPRPSKELPKASVTIAEKYLAAPKVYGREKTIILANGEKLRGKYVISEAGEFVPSHDPFSFSKTKGFPINEEGRTVNDRDYEKDKDAQKMVLIRANKFDGRAISNPVIVTKDGIVVSGNDRTMAGIIAAQQGTDKEYLEMLTNEADMYGISPEDLKGFKNPRISIELERDIPYTTETFARFNKDDKKSQNKVEKAVKVAKTINEGTIRKASTIIDGFDTLGDFYANEGAIKELVSVLVSDGVIIPEQISEIMDGSSLSAIGKDQVETLLTGAVLNEDSIRLLNREGLKPYRNKIVKSVVSLIENRSLGDYAIMDRVNGGIRLLDVVYNGGFKHVREYLQQPALFGSKEVGPTEAYFAHVLMGKERDFRTAVDGYNGRAKMSASGQPDMFSGKIKTKDEILNDIENEATGDTRQLFELVRNRNSVIDAQQENGGNADALHSVDQEQPNAPVGNEGVDQGAGAGVVEQIPIDNQGKNGGVENPVVTENETPEQPLPPAEQPQIDKISSDNETKLKEIAAIQPDDAILFRSPYFYSPTETALSAIKQEKATPEQWKAMLLKNGAKQAEMDWMQFDEFVDGKKLLTRVDIQEWADQNKIEVQEVEKSDANQGRKDYVSRRMSELDSDINNWADIGLSKWEVKKAEKEYAKLSKEYDEILKNTSPTKFSQYTEPGGENYKEMLLTMPQKPTSKPYKQWLNENWNGTDDAEARQLYSIQIDENEPNFNSSHFNEPNILAHIRFDERTGKNGEKVLFIEEIQSDWAQKGKKEGFKGAILLSHKKELDGFYQELEQTNKELDTTLKQMHEMGLPQGSGSTLIQDFSSGVSVALYSVNKEYRNLSNYLDTVRNNKEYDGIKGKMEEIENKARELGTKRNNLIVNRNILEQKAAEKESALKIAKESNSYIPNMPFKKTDQWVNLSLRRMMTYAAENGFDAIAWTTGEMQADRYDLSKQIDLIEGARLSGGYELTAKKDGNTVFSKSNMSISEVEDTFGKDIAHKIENQESSLIDLSGLDLKVGGSGMKGFYDNIIPAQANKIGKQFGAQVQTIEIPDSEVAYNENKELDPKDLSPQAKILTNKYEKSIEEGGSYTPENYVEDMAKIGYIVNMDFLSGEPISVTKASEGKFTPVQSIPITDKIREQAAIGMPLFSIIGEKGASALDLVDNARARMNDLSVARNMESMDKKAKDILLVTGWQRGADNKWRYELPDIINEKKIDKRTEGKYEAAFSADEVCSKELLSAYPGIKDVLVKIGINPVNRERGSYATGVDRSAEGLFDLSLEINVSAKDIQNAKEILIHEVQHYIQDVEGFATGGNSHTLTEPPDGMVEKIFKLFDMNTIREIMVRNNIGGDYQGEMPIRWLEGIRNQVISSPSDWIRLNSIIDDNSSRAWSMWNLNTGGNGYHRLAGEVEARNAVNRSKMTEAERRSSLLENTEDVSRSDQIFFQKARIANSQLENITGDMMAREALSLAETLNTPVRIITDINEIPASKVRFRKAKGWFDPKTGEVVIVLPNNNSIADTQASVLHEVVAHKGLRGLLGNEFNPTMEKIFKSMPDYAKADFLAKYGDKVAAAEEYTAQIAEKDIDPTVWQKIMAIIRDAFRSLGINLRMNKADVAFMLWRSKNRLKDQKNVTSLEVLKDLGEASEVKEKFRSMYQMTPQSAEIARLEAIKKAAIIERNRLIRSGSDRIGLFGDTKISPNDMFGGEGFDPSVINGLIKEQEDLVKVVDAKISLLRQNEMSGLIEAGGQMQLESMVNFRDGEQPIEKNAIFESYEKADRTIKKNGVFEDSRPKDDWAQGEIFFSVIDTPINPGTGYIREKGNQLKNNADRITYIERQLTEQKGITFIGAPLSGAAKIKSSADIAFLFKNLESAATENAFAVLIDKSGDYKVLYISSGGTTSSIIENKLITSAAIEFNASSVCLVHNHPSGSLKASPQDLLAHKALRKTLAHLGKNIELAESVIINTDSGKYVTFDDSLYQSLDKESGDDIYNPSVYQFDRLKLYLPNSERTTITNSTDIAVYLSKMKRGTTPKLGVITIDRKYQITNYALYDETISAKNLISNIIQDIGKYGENVIIHSNNDLGKSLFDNINKALKPMGSELIDVIISKQSPGVTSSYKSFIQGEIFLSEPDSPYNNILFRNSDEMVPETNYIELTTGEKWIERLQDRMVSGSKLIAEIKSRGGKVGSFSNFVSEETRASSRGKAELDDFVDNYFKPLTDIIGKWVSKGVSQDETANYMKAKHAPEVNKVITSREVYGSITPKLRSENELKFLNENNNLIRAIIADSYDRVFSNSTAPALDFSNLISTELLIAKHIQSKATKALTEISKTDDGNIRSGKSDIEAKRVIDDFEAKHTPEEITGFWDNVRNATRFSVEKSYKYGLVGKETYEYTKTMYQYYVPLRGWDIKEEIDYSDIFGENYMGHEILSPVNKKAQGRQSEAENPLGWIGSMAETAIVAGNKNEVRRNAWRLVKDNADMTDLFLIKDTWLLNVAAPGEEAIWVPTYETPTQEQLDNGTARKAPQNNAYNWHKTKVELEKHQVPVMIDGKRVIMEFKGEFGARVAAAINGDNVTRWKGTEGLGKVTRIMAALKTSKNPDFMLTNFARDYFFGTMAHYIRGGNSFTLTANLRRSWIAIHKDFTNGKEDVYLKKLYEDFKMNGGETGYVHMLGQKDFQKVVEKMIKEADDVGKISPELAAKKVWKGLNTGLDYLALMSENAMRFATYMTGVESLMKKAGVDVATEGMKKQSALAAKELTTNFNRKGRWGSQIGAGYAFFNASIQGTTNYLKLAKENPARFIAFNLGIMALRTALHALCMLLSGEDDEDNYKGLSDYIKENNFVLPTGTGTYITIPLPHGARAFTNIGPYALDVMTGRKDADFAISEYLKNIVSEVSPVNLVGLDKSAFLMPTTFSEAMLTITPTALRPVAEAGANIDFMSNPIERKNFILSDSEYIPRFQNAYASTNKILVGGAKYLNRIGGGNDFRTAALRIDKETGVPYRSKVWGLFDVSPAYTEHILESYLGGAGRFVNDLYKTGRSITKGETPKMQNIPVFRRFYQEPYETSAWRGFYETRTRVSDIDKAKKAAQDTGDDAEFVNLNNIYNNTLSWTFDRYNKAMRSLAKEKKMLPDKDPQIKEINKLLDDVVGKLDQEIKAIDKRYNKK